MVKFTLTEIEPKIFKLEFLGDLTRSDVQVRNTWLNKFFEGHVQSNGEELQFYKDLEKSLIDTCGTSTGFIIEQKHELTWVFYLKQKKNKESDGSFLE